jgi:hypothetical protein
VTAADRPLRHAVDLRPAHERRLELIPALSMRSRIARHHGIAPQAQLEVDAHELRLPGIGGRYLAGVATHVAAHGWPADEVAALLAALEDRCAMWIVCSSGAALGRAGLGPEGARPLRAAAARFAGGRWGPARIPAAETISDLMRAGSVRGAVCAAAESGRQPPSSFVRAAAAGGAHAASMDRGLARALGARWAIELLVAPSIPSGSLVGLREQVAVAPRCGWCRAPLVGSTCRRCAPGVRA